MSNKNLIIISLVSIAAILILYFSLKLSNKNKEIKQKDKTIDDLEIGYLDLILDNLKNDKNIDNITKKHIENLIKVYKEINNNVALELIKAMSLLNIGENEKALFSLTKIIENLLNTKCKNCNSDNFSALINECKEKKIITLGEASEMHELRILRNKEGHRLNVKFNETLKIKSYMSAIEIILKLSQKNKEKQA